MGISDEQRTRINAELKAACGGEYVWFWGKGKDGGGSAELDGSFTASQLRAIADIIDRETAAQSPDCQTDCTPAADL